MSDYTFPTREQFWKDDEMLEVIKKRGIKAAITDFSILLGGCPLVTDYGEISYIDGNIVGGFYWTRSDNGKYDPVVIDPYCNGGFCKATDRAAGARPALPFSSINKIPTNGVSGKRTAADGVLEVKYGFYPQSAVSRKMQQELEQQFKSGKLNKTVNRYTTDSRALKAHDEKFKAKIHEEYEYKGKRYIRVKAKFYLDREHTLSNGEKYINGDNVWIEVEPIKWLVSKKDKLLLTEKIVFAGVQFNYERDYYTEDFEKTDIKKFMDKYWSKDIEQLRSKRKNYGNWY